MMNQKQTVIAVLGVIINSKKEVLLSLRNDPVNIKADQKWEIPGGKIEFGETASECLIREMKEETGYVVQPKEIVQCIWSNIWELSDGLMVQAILIPFLCQIIGGTEKAQAKEISQLKWVNQKQLKELSPLLPGVKEIILTAMNSSIGGSYNYDETGL